MRPGRVGLGGVVAEVWSSERRTELLAYEDVLVVAPDLAGVSQVPEVDAIGDLGYRVRLLQGEVDDRRLYRVAQDQRFDIVHFMLHGSIDDLTVSGGRLTRNAVLQLVTLTGAKIVFLNACSSAGLGQMLVNAGVAVAIASVAEVGDSAAWQTAVTFYAELARCGDVSRAYKAACVGGDVLYVFLSDGGYAALMARPVLEELRGLRGDMERSQAAQVGLRGDLRRLVWLVGGSAALAASSVGMLGLHVWVR